MTCYAPVRAYYGKEVSEDGRRPLVFNVNSAWSGVPIDVPCGKCIGCLKTTAQAWAVRCFHEQLVHGFGVGSFVTLTYDEMNYPVGGSVSIREFQLFMKRLRKVKGNGVRFFGCGEYGSLTLRPHYHVLLFNVFFGDRKFYKKTPLGYDLFRSEELSCIWSFGSAEIGDVSARSAGYVAKYMVKEDPRLVGRAPQFRLMSRKPGLGFEWLQKYGVDAYRHDDCVVDGLTHCLPRYYDSKFVDIDSNRVDELKVERRLAKMEPEARFNNTVDRRRVRERFDQLKSKRFARET